ncbi:ABC transporter permease [Paenibacillus thalictri]|uniref:Sugar ABC transporter permease n=1 Tax=Paenibacillus thalictri TaxID=2527873 RepID=A0A4Q9DHH5_9BACL|nr:ABC transporter permease subunit [Paenibacillus thalictri]TBL70515.1 sugar ABC transporter permease [Paenibacillus thalictri]
MSSKRSSFLKSQTRDLTILAVPALLLLLLLNYLPMGGLVLAFKNYRYDQGIFGSDWVGLKNFYFLFSSQDAWRITRNTVGLNLLFIVTVTAGAVYFAILLSEILHKKFIRLYQTTLFFPYFLSWPVVALIVFAFLDVDLGILNHLLGSVGIEPVMWYSEAGVWPLLLVFITFWKSIGYNTLIYYAGIMAFDRSYYEAAAVDGATVTQMRRYITVPLLIPLVTIMTLIQLGHVFHSDFGLFYMVTRDSGALYPATDVIDTYVYRSLRVVGDTGMAAAVGFYQAVVGFMLVLLANAVVRKINKENSMF